MRTIDIAQQAGVHVNTVRLYEQWHYISPVPRQKNGYRNYSDLHLQQMRIARLAFKQEFIQNNLRKIATGIVRLSGHEQFSEALVAANDYLHFLKRELVFAKQAVHMANALLHDAITPARTYSHKEIAMQLELTEETIRNWERNGLFTVARDAQNRRIYNEQDVQKLLIIRTLRSAHFSIASILHLFEQIDSVEQVADLHELLNSAQFKSEFYHVTDELEHNLREAICNTKELITILEKLQ